MIISILNESYITISKGPITAQGHFIIIPINHYTSRTKVSKMQTGEERETGLKFLNEVETVTSKIKEIFSERNLGMITFEVSAGDRYF